MSKRRVDNEPAYILHSYDWSESSLVLETFTQSKGRYAILAKGAKRPLSGFRSTLLPLQSLRLSFSLPLGSEGQIATLKAAEWAGGLPMPSAEGLMAGLYMNELLLRFLAREDAHPTLFGAYDALVQTLSGAAGAIGWRNTVSIGVVLRAFELILLQEVGYLPSLNTTLRHESLQEHGLYVLEPSVGLREVNLSEPEWMALAMQGVQWLQLHTALEQFVRALTLDQAYQPDLASRIRPLLEVLLLLPLQKLRVQLRRHLVSHLGEAGLKTRELFIQTQAK